MSLAIKAIVFDLGMLGNFAIYYKYNLKRESCK